MILVSRRGVLAGLPAFAGGGARARVVPEDWISITMPGLRHVVCKAEIGERPIRVVIDTGASRTILSRSLAADLGLAAAPAHATRGLTGEVQVLGAGPVTLAIGDHRLVLAQVDVADLSPLAFSQAFTIDAVVGRELFDTARVRFDFAAGRMWIEAVDAVAASEGYRRLALTRDLAGRMLVDATIEGFPAVAEIDLGSDVPAYVSMAACEGYRLLVNRASSMAASAGVEGFSLDRIFTVDRLALAGWTLSGPPARVPPGWASEASILLGLPVLRRFDLCFEANTGALWLRPSQSAFNQPFRKDRSGIAAGWSGDGLRIVFVAPGSPAEKAGLKPGDVIASVNGKKADGAFVARGERLGAGPAGQQVVLETSGGRRVAIRLNDYF